MIKKVIRVVWICHFSNPEILRKLHIVHKINGFAPWIPSTIQELDGCDDIELHVVSPHSRIMWKKEFIEKGVHYYFYPLAFPCGNGLIKKVFPSVKVLLAMMNKWFVRNIVYKINPDIIHLHGAENDYYSSMIFQFKEKYPILITIQGFISHTTDKTSEVYKNRIEVELKILRLFTHFGIRTKTMEEDIKKINPDAVMHWHWYSIPPLEPINVPKEYDIVYFSRFCKDKGIEDFLQAVKIVKETAPDVTVVIIGNASVEYKNYLHKLAQDYLIEENILQWIEYLTPDDLHDKVARARIKVLPTYGGDIITGSILESMLLAIPVVAYESGSVVEVNQQGENMIAVKTGDVKGISTGILKLLNDEEYRNVLGQRGRAYALKSLRNTYIKRDLVKCYGDTIRAYNNER